MGDRDGRDRLNGAPPALLGQEQEKQGSTALPSQQAPAHRRRSKRTGGSRRDFSNCRIDSRRCAVFSNDDDEEYIDASTAGVEFVGVTGSVNDGSFGHSHRRCNTRSSDTVSTSDPVLLRVCEQLAKRPVRIKFLRRREVPRPQSQLPSEHLRPQQLPEPAGTAAAAATQQRLFADVAAASAIATTTTATIATALVTDTDTVAQAAATAAIGTAH